MDGENSTVSRCHSQYHTQYLASEVVKIEAPLLEIVEIPEKDFLKRSGVTFLPLLDEFLQAANKNEASKVQSHYGKVLFIKETIHEILCTTCHGCKSRLPVVNLLPTALSLRSFLY